jgi:hypothetical protein
MRYKRQLYTYSLLVLAVLVYLGWQYIPRAQIQGSYIFRIPKSKFVVPSPTGDDRLILENNGDFYSNFYGPGHYEVISRGLLSTSIALTMTDNGQSRGIELLVKRGFDFHLQLVFFPGSDILYRKE